MSIFQSILIWFGAGISIAEIITGTYFAPLGLAKGAAAIFLGHAIGCALFFATGLVGAFTKKTAMQTTALSFGKVGAKFFALLNVLQLAGWTGIMIYDGSLSAGAIFAAPSMPFGSRSGPGIEGVGASMPFGLGTRLAAIIIGALIVVWILIGITNLGKLNVVAMAALFALTLVLCARIFGGTSMPFCLGTGPGIEASDALSFGAAVELSVAMPLSWLPVVSDYTRDAKRPVASSLASTLSYFATSCWMYFIGMLLAFFTGDSSIESAMLKAGLGLSALLIIVLSTVTTTFLDAFSAGISGQTVFEKSESKRFTKIFAICVAVIGTVGAVIFNMDNITDFLYLIGSVFAPMTAILLSDFFVLKNNSEKKSFDVQRLFVWLCGLLVYRLFMKVDFVLGSTLPSMAATFFLNIAVSKISSCMAACDKEK